MPFEKDKPRHYKELKIWQKGMWLAKLVYELTQRFPDGERFGLVSQMRRAAVSIPSNIAEGQARQGRGEFLQFLSHAYGSSAELETQTLLSVQLGFCRSGEIEKVIREIDEIQKMVVAIRRKLSGLPRHSSLATRHIGEGTRA